MHQCTNEEVPTDVRSRDATPAHEPMNTLSASLSTGVHKGACRETSSQVPNDHQTGTEANLQERYAHLTTALLPFLQISFMHVIGNEGARFRGADSHAAERNKKNVSPRHLDACACAQPARTKKGQTRAPLGKKA